MVLIVVRHSLSSELFQFSQLYYVLHKRLFFFGLIFNFYFYCPLRELWTFDFLSKDLLDSVSSEFVLGLHVIWSIDVILYKFINLSFSFQLFLWLSWFMNIFFSLFQSLVNIFEIRVFNLFLSVVFGFLCLFFMDLLSFLVSLTFDFLSLFNSCTYWLFLSILILRYCCDRSHFSSVSKIIVITVYPRVMSGTSIVWHYFFMIFIEICVYKLLNLFLLKTFPSFMLCGLYFIYYVIVAL